MSKNTPRRLDNVLDRGCREVEDFLRRVESDRRVKDKSDGLITIQISVTADHEALPCGCQHVMEGGRRSEVTRMLEIDRFVTVARGP